LTHDTKNREIYFVQLPPELDQKIERYLEEDSFGYESKDEFVRDAVRRHVELMNGVNV